MRTPDHQTPLTATADSQDVVETSAVKQSEAHQDERTDAECRQRFEFLGNFGQKRRQTWHRGLRCYCNRAGEARQPLLKVGLPFGGGTALKRRTPTGRASHKQFLSTCRAAGRGPDPHWPTRPSDGRTASAALHKLCRTKEKTRRAHAPGGPFRLAVWDWLEAVHSWWPQRINSTAFRVMRGFRAEALSLSHLTWDTTVTFRFHIFGSPSFPV